MKKIKEIFEKNNFKSSAGLDNDFSNMIYLINNFNRKRQIEIFLEREIYSAKTSIIPPQIEVYDNGFSLLAVELVYGVQKREKLFKYSDLSYKFFLYALLWKDLKESKTEYSPDFDLGENAHKICNSVSDFSRFLKTIFYENKISNLKDIKEEDFKEDLWSLKMISLAKKYFEEEEKFRKNKGDFVFFTQESACLELLNALEKKNLRLKPKDFSKLIVVEDCEDMKPIFKKIADSLFNLGYPVEKINSSDFLEVAVEEKKVIDLKGFIDSYDEAEYVSYKIKKMFCEKKAKEGEIAVVSFDGETKELLPYAFGRFGIKESSKNKVGSSPVFRLFSYYLELFFYKKIHFFKYEEIFKSEFSAFKIDEKLWSKKIKIDFKEGNEFKFLTDLIYESWKVAQLKEEKISNFFPLESIKKSASEEDYSKIKIIMEADFGDFERNLLTSLFEKCITNLDDENLISFLSESFEMEDSVLNEIKDFKEKKMMAFSILKIIGESEFYPKYAKKEDFFVPVFKPEQALNSSSQYVFVVGLNSKADKPEPSPIPAVLLRRLGLVKEGESYSSKRHLEIFNKLNNLLKSKREVYLSYGYYDINGDTAGVSNLIRWVKSLDENLIDYDKDSKIGFSLYSFADIVKKEKRSPNLSYSYFRLKKDIPKENLSVERENPRPFIEKVRNYKICDILACNGKNKGEIKFNILDFVSFINCPKRFTFKVFSEMLGLEEETDYEAEKSLRSGTFWHKLLHKAAEFEDFYSKSKDKIFNCLVKAQEETLKTHKPEVFEDSETEEFKKNNIFKLKLFSENEEERQKELDLSGVFLEKKLSREIGRVNGNIKVFLEGRLDRVDYSKAKKAFFVWDYKTGKPRKLVLNSRNKQKPSKNYFYELQLAAYVYLLKESGELAKAVNEMKIEKDFKIYGFNIFKNGKFNMKRYDEIDDKSFFGVNIQEMISEFVRFLDHDSLKILNKNYGVKEVKFHNPNCQYCDYKEVCRFLSLEKEIKDA
ncbi:MAG TPA: PD-(D/E)XK nuclease family protein [Elusimicrobiales bacterium]|nr:PD-(D/E)XK nuclease family protein [Elusimicrobiales bacterium]HOL62317.1 PD-(D/E)XK nuclease family protein [Elusimicrobiales bacterium]HPO94980.1 PD-(D/E)XK nuclease family protein [Elusimicrobiales bacterium]